MTLNFGKNSRMFLPRRNRFWKMVVILKMKFVWGRKLKGEGKTNLSEGQMARQRTNLAEGNFIDQSNFVLKS